jgi:pimeloyl-ACP methyl ester carboxylesterase
MTEMNDSRIESPEGGRLINGVAGNAGDELSYQLYLPATLRPSRPVLTAVHGISRNPLDWLNLFKPSADTHGVALFTPLFDEARFGDFQRLGRHGRGQRADHALIRVLDKLSDEHGMRPSMALFGFSGGAQFAHRFAMVHSSRVSSLVLGAAGWYTWPDSSTGFPYGTRPISALPGVNFDPEKLLSIPIRVIVGRDDTIRDQTLNTRARIDKTQGRTRRDRAENWVRAMHTLALARNLPARVDLQFLDGTGHSVLDRGSDRMLRSLTCNWFFDSNNNSL